MQLHAATCHISHAACQPTATCHMSHKQSHAKRENTHLIKEDSFQGPVHNRLAVHFTLT